MSSHKIDIKQLNDDTTVFIVATILDNENAQELTALIMDASDKGFNYVIIDLKTLEFISSAGVGAILGTVEILRDKGGDIILCNASKSILHVFDILDLRDYLTIKESENESEKILCNGVRSDDGK